MLAPLSNELTRDELLSLIDGKARRAGRDSSFVLHHYAAGTLEDLGRPVQAYCALCDLLGRDAPHAHPYRDRPLG